MSEEFDYSGYDDPGGYDGGYDTGGYDAGLPDEHWSADPELVQFADAFMDALHHDPKLVEQWYSDYAKEANLRGLAEAEEAYRLETEHKAGTGAWKNDLIKAMKQANKGAA